MEIAMLHLLIIAGENQGIARLRSELGQHGFTSSVASADEGVDIASRQSPDIALVEAGGSLPAAVELAQRLKQARPLPVIVLLPGELLDSVDGQLKNADDFITVPCDARELVIRAKRLLNIAGNTDGSELVRCDGLVIDLTQCEVTVDGRKAELTFKEYELLKLLASHPGRVYTRQALLDKVWGYDYYGGDRTVDVHVRRLRSKIEDSRHSFVETVRNVGYRFRKP